MHATTPGVERAVSGARAWADRLGAEHVSLAHYVLALLDEEEGRPAVLLARVGVSVATAREFLTTADSAVAVPVGRLFNSARDWSIRYRHDPEFLTDALLVAVLKADAEFGALARRWGFGAEVLEAALGVRGETHPPAPSLEGGGGAQSDETSHESSGPTLPRPSVRLPPSDGAPPPPSREGAGGWVEPATDLTAARVLDANFNRAREAARVLDDYCRFALDDRFLTEQVKELRHGLAAAAQKLPQAVLLAARDTRGDVGTTATAGREYERSSPAHVAQVNLKRLQESLRSLEEFGKVFGPDLGRDLEALRYRAYTLERAVTLGARARERLANARLYVLVTRSLCPAALDWTVREAARGGADVFQLREKSLADRELLTLARDVRRWTRETGTLFVVNDRPDIARLAEADGVHLGQDDMSVRDARRVAGPDILIGMSTHSVEQLRAAVLDGADYVGIGPTFPSKTKAFDHFPGLEFVRAATAETSLPAFALGGISAANLGEVIQAGARRVAVSAAVCAADDPEQAALTLKSALMS